MLYRAKTLAGYKLKAKDGKVGKAKEFYFDDNYWAIRYLVANTGNWLTGRQVLLSPYLLVAIDDDDENIVVSSNKGDPAVNDSKSKAGQAYRNIVDRLMGQELPIMELDNKKGVFGKIKKLLAI